MNHFFQVTGLLQPGVTVAQANAQLLAAAPQYHRRVSRHRSAAALYGRTTARQHHRRRAQFAADDAGRGGPGAADRLRQCRQSAAGARHGPQARVRHPLRTRSRPRAHRAPIADRKRAALRWRRHSRPWFSAFLECAPCWPSVPRALPRIGENGSAIGIDWRVLGFTLGGFAAHRHSLRTVSRASAPRAPT